MQKTKQGLIANIILILSSTTVLIILLEFIVRIFYLAPPVAMDHHETFCKYDSLLGFKLVPNMNTELKTQEFNVTISTNSKGIRGPEYAYGKKENTYRILILGDSFAEGYTVNFEDLFSQITQKILNKNFKDSSVEIINTGVGGYGTDQQLLFFLNEGYKYNSDLVVVLFCWNDVIDNISTLNKPYFRLQDNLLILNNVPVVITHHNLDNKIPLLRLKNILYSHSALSRFIKFLIESSPVYNRMIINPYRQRINKQFKVWESSYDEEIKRGWKITEAILKSLRDQAINNNANLLIVYVPDKMEIYDEVWKSTLLRYSIKQREWNRYNIRNQLKMICQELDISFFDPTDAFINESKRLSLNRQNLYFRFDAHWNRFGHELIGRLLAQYIKNNY